MDAKTKIEIKVEDPLSDDVAPQNETEFFTKDVAMKTNGDAVLLGNDCDVPIKSDVKLESSFPDFCLQREREYCTKHVEQIKFDTLSGSNNYETDIKAEISSQIEIEYLSKDLVMKVKKYNSDYEMENKIEIKEEAWWLETETSHVCNDTESGDFIQVKSPRLCTEPVFDNSSDDLPLLSTEATRKNSSFSYGNECESQEYDVTNMPAVEERAHPELSGECSDREAVYDRGILNHKGDRLLKCNLCDQSFTQLSDLKLHILDHEGIEPYKCPICEKSFIALLSFKRHMLTHDSKNPYKCEICKKSFTQSSALKSHNLIHQGKKPHRCELCDKNFTQLGHLKRHNVIHKNNMPHICEICGERFTRLSLLKTHNFLHEGKKLHKCKVCEQMFTQLSNLKTHYLIHEGKKLHLCEICGKTFTRLSHLKGHSLIHESKKPV